MLALVFQVLRRDAHGRIGKEDIVLADLGGTFHENVSFECRASADRNTRPDYRVGTNVGGWIDARAGIDDRGRMNRHPLTPRGGRPAYTAFRPRPRPRR